MDSDLASDVRRVSSGRASQSVFLSVMALLFLVSSVVTVVWCGSMAGMGEMQMPGDWTMSMTWMLMPGQTWAEAAATFIGMWAVMMVAMMLPSLVPMLARYRQAVGPTPRLGALTARVAIAYFAMWTALGAALYPLGIAVAVIEMRNPAVSRVVPVLTALVVLGAGLLQFSSWKQRHLACCRGTANAERTLHPDAATAWRHGLRLGLHCIHCCAGATAVLLVLGVMDLGVMAIVAAAITLERLAPAERNVARAIGAVGVGAGVVLLAEAAGLS